MFGVKERRFIVLFKNGSKMSISIFFVKKWEMGVFCKKKWKMGEGVVKKWTFPQRRVHYV